MMAIMIVSLLYSACGTIKTPDSNTPTTTEEVSIPTIAETHTPESTTAIPEPSDALLTKTSIPELTNTPTPTQMPSATTTTVKPSSTYTPSSLVTEKPTFESSATTTPTRSIPPTPEPTIGESEQKTPPVCLGRSPGNLEYFSIYPDYDPSGHMGDIGDIVNVSKGPEGVHFTYEVRGRGPQEWDWKYIDGELNPNPAKFAGVMYLCCGWGESPGFDLRDFHRAITWEARSLSGEVNVEFIIGGVDWEWDNTNKVKVTPPCPDSLRRKPLGVYTLNETWQLFNVELTIPEEEFVNVIGGFSWVITWGSAGIQPNDQGTAPSDPKTIEVEIRNIRYER
jgi:hypothetical protein